MPDAISSYMFQGKTYIVTANEGDSRDYDGYSEEARVRELPLDPDAFPDAASLQQDDNLGRLKSTTANGDTDGDGDPSDATLLAVINETVQFADGTTWSEV